MAANATADMQDLDRPGRGQLARWRRAGRAAPAT
jgi:hypothetical protein